MKLIVTGLETFLGLSLAEDEVTFWMGMLGDYEPWRLAELKSYRLDERGYGRTLAHICKWLDELKPRPEEQNREYVRGLKMLEHKPDKQIPKCVGCRFGKMISSKFSDEEKDILDRVWVDVMRKKYPGVTWDCQRKNNKGY